jgi:hypothetical protein
VGALDRVAGRVRDNPWMAVAAVAAAVLIAAWLAWAVYVVSDRGLNEGIGVLIAWPALLVGAALLVVPFVGAFLVIRRHQADRNSRPHLLQSQDE